MSYTYPTTNYPKHLGLLSVQEALTKNIRKLTLLFEKYYLREIYLAS